MRSDGSSVTSVRGGRGVGSNYYGSRALGVSGDGTMIAFVRRGQMRLLTGAGSRAVEFVDGDGPQNRDPQVHDPSFSPDGATLVFAAAETPVQQQLFEVDLTTFVVRKLDVAAEYLSSPKYSPDGQTIAYGCGTGGVCVAPTAGGEPRTIIPRAAKYSGEKIGVTLAWSPDGRHLTYDCGRNYARICVSDANGKNRRVIARGTTPDWFG